MYLDLNVSINRIYMSKEQFEFIMYMIHACANKWGQTPGEVYKTLKDHGCLTQYLIPCYDVLHTLGTQTVVTDIEQYLQNARIEK